jgi:hypothetical protein
LKNGLNKPVRFHSYIVPRLIISAELFFADVTVEFFFEKFVVCLRLAESGKPILKKVPEKFLIKSGCRVLRQIPS